MIKKKLKSIFEKVKRRKARIALMLSLQIISALSLAAPAFAEAGGTGAGGTGSGEAQFNTVVTFFATWIGRIGLVVAFVGAIMFGFAIKNDDADGKQRGLTTLGAGFIVFAVTKALDMFGIA